ncbi:zinc transport system permease protein [Paenibacillus catalpae]|uniref:Zinc transport system permease protein n=2 Tax=Paenibacillus catalpae TaxID=1045775 RepID=A0A1I1V353_9BACL|nr:zinc transport system permease protein [Paenibacillus catalpae]
MLHYDFMQRAFCAGGIIALIASALGVYLLLRRQALMADMLSHVSLAGVAAGAYLRINPSITGFIVAIIGAIAVEYVRKAYKTYSELSVAIIMVGGLSVSIILMTMNKTINKSFSSYLFGSVVAVNQLELTMMLAAALIGALFFFLLRKPLYIISFDEESARTSGIPVQWISVGFSIITGMIVAAAMPIVGVLLVSSLIILPAALSVRIAPSFTSAILVSMGIGLTGTFTGLTASYELSTPPGGTIAFILLLFLVSGLCVRKIILLASKSTSKKMRPEIAVKESRISKNGLSSNLQKIRQR